MPGAAGMGGMTPNMMGMGMGMGGTMPGMVQTMPGGGGSRATQTSGENVYRPYIELLSSDARAGAGAGARAREKPLALPRERC